MKEKLAFGFYSQLKGEDAPPYLGDGLIAVADGLGGSGSTVHALRPEERKAVRREIRRRLIPAEAREDRALGEYLDALLHPLFDKKPHTSAFWASRLVMARFACAAAAGPGDLCDEQNRARLAAYLREGLCIAAESAHLEQGGLTGQLLLPTTFSALRLRAEGDIVRAEAFWAGDSRCYALTRDGLRLLSVDDEDRAGSIVNLFAAGGKAATLHCRSYEFSAPCAFLAVSDGVFDPYEHDHFLVEHILLSALTKAQSAEEAASALRRHYDGVHADDATMAFLPVGFSTYAELRAFFAPRAEKTAKMFTRFCEMERKAEAAGTDEEEATGYVRRRTQDKLDAIVELFAAARLRGEEDIACTEPVRGAVDRAAAEAAQSMRQALDSAREKKLAVVRERLLSDPVRARDALSRGRSGKNAGVLLASNAVVHAANGLLSARRALDRRMKRKDELEQERKQLIFDAQAEADRLFERYRAMRSSDPQEALRALREGVAFAAAALGQGNGSASVSSLLLRALAQNGERLRRTIEACAAEERRAANAAAAYAGAVEKFLVRCAEQTDRAPESIFSREFVHACGLTRREELSPDARTVAAAALASLRGLREEAAEGIVRALAAHYGQRSAADEVYNATKLRAFRLYFEVKDCPEEEIEKFCSDFSAFEGAYLSLLA